MNKKGEILVRIYVGFLLIAFLGVSIVSRAFYIQTVKGNYYRSLSDTLTIFPKDITAARGNIYAENGKLLATSLPIFDLYIDFKADGLTKDIFRKNVDSVALLLSAKFPSKSENDFKKELTNNRIKGNGYYALCKNISLQDLHEMKHWPWFRLSRNKSGLIIDTKEKRDHPFGDLALRTLGIDENMDGYYSSGVELKYDAILKGITGVKFYRKLSGGACKPLDNKEEIVSQPGKDIYTTLDVTLQDVAEESLRRALSLHDAEHGTVVLMEVKSGKIRAIANLGKQDTGYYKEKLNYAVGEATEPGSTFKLATLAALMEDGLANKNTSVAVGNGVFTIRNLTIKDHEEPETPNLLMKRAIEVSSNVAIAKTVYNAYSANPKKLYAHFEKFGFTKPVDIELSGAAKPILAAPQKWSGVSSAYLAHGYELQITPLHTLQFYNAIANNGVLVKPTIISKIREYNKTVDSTVTKVLDGNLFTQKNVKELQEILEGVVENGTAKNLKTDYLKIAGKTGTAVIANKGYKGNKKYQASFVGYFPAESPQYSMIVLINSPSNGVYYGNVVAGTIFREVADKVYSLSIEMHSKMNVGNKSHFPLISNAPQEDISHVNDFFGVHLTPTNSAWLKGVAQGENIQYLPEVISAKSIPNVVGMGVKDALYLLESSGLEVEIKGTGIVANQSLNAGENFTKKQKITLSAN